MIRLEGAAALTLLVALGCGGDDLADWGGTMVDSAGVTIVTNPDVGIWTPTTQWTLVDDLTIGTAGGDPDYQFGQIAGIAVASDGSMFVLDQQASEVRVFDPSGNLTHRFAKQGNGPGELAPTAGPVLLTSGDTIVVPDIQNQRVNRYAASGESLGSFRFDFTQGIPVRWDVTPAGALANQVRPFPTPQNQTPDSMDLIATRDAEGAVIDTLMHFRSGQTFQVRGDRAQLRFFSPEAVWTLAHDDALWFAVNDNYRISVFGPGAVLERVVTKPFTLSPIGERDREVIKNAILGLARDAGAPPQALQRFEESMGFADNFPAFAQLIAGPAGTVWVQHIQVPSALSDEELETYNPQLSLGAGVWDVFDIDGRFLGALTMPDRFQPVRATGNQLYGIWRDELDVQYVKRLRVEGIPTGDDTGGLPIGEQ